MLCEYTAPAGGPTDRDGGKKRGPSVVRVQEVEEANHSDHREAKETVAEALQAEPG